MSIPGRAAAKGANRNKDASSYQRQFMKTEFCRFLATGCRNGRECPFAHGNAELRTRPNLTKTSICTLWKEGRCPHGERECRFAHGLNDLRNSDEFVRQLPTPSVPTKQLELDLEPPEHYLLTDLLADDTDELDEPQPDEGRQVQAFLPPTPQLRAERQPTEVFIPIPKPADLPVPFKRGETVGNVYQSEGHYQLFQEQGKTKLLLDNGWTATIDNFPGKPRRGQGLSMSETSESDSTSQGPVDVHSSGKLKAAENTEARVGHPRLSDRIHKTDLCRFYESGMCRHGANCTFAHGKEELKQRPDLAKTALCPYWERGMPCVLGPENCRYAHGEHELRRLSDVGTDQGNNIMSQSTKPYHETPSYREVPVRGFEDFSHPRKLCTLML